MPEFWAAPEFFVDTDNVKEDGMSTNLIINIWNDEQDTKHFFVFQEPPAYAGVDQSKVYSNSIFDRGIGGANSGASAQFKANLQFYAGVQQAGVKPPTQGEVSGESIAIQAVDLTTSDGSSVKNCVTMTLDQDDPDNIGLVGPAYDQGVPSGSFRIVTATFDSLVTPFNVGSAISAGADGAPIMSNFVKGDPQTNYDCEPILKFYVAVGGYQAGTVMNFSEHSKNAAVCDFTGGHSVINVHYTNEGGWSSTIIR